MKRSTHELFLLASILLVLVWSGIEPRDRFTWYLEVFPAVVGLAVVLALRARLPLSTMTLWLIWLHCIILLVGGHYTYAEVPFFNWLRDTLGTARNSYDRLGHFAQGFVPAIIVREILLRRTELKRGKVLFFLTVCVCLAISAFYELFEAGVSIATSYVTGEGAEAFLGMQGDVWDTQKDMGMALLGAILAQLLLGRWHDRSIESVYQREPK